MQLTFFCIWVIIWHVIIKPSTNNYYHALKLHHVYLQNSTLSPTPSSHWHFQETTQPADEAGRVGRSMQMSLWLLGNLAHSGIVTSQSYVEYGRAPCDLCLTAYSSLDSCHSAPFSGSYYTCCFKGMYVATFFSNQNKVICKSDDGEAPAQSCDLWVPFRAQEGSFYLDTEAIFISSFCFHYIWDSTKFALRSNVKKNIFPSYNLRWEFYDAGMKRKPFASVLTFHF